MKYPDLRQFDVIALDTETTGLTRRDRMFGFSVAGGDWAEYYDIRDDPNSLSWLDDQMEHYKGTIAFFNAPFDVIKFKDAGIDIPLELIDDTSIRAVLINENEYQYTLDWLARTHLGVQKAEPYDELADLFGGRATRNAQMPNLQRAPVRIVRPYALRDAEITLRLWKFQEHQIESQGVRAICEFERSVIPTIIGMAEHGVRVDLDAAERARESIVPIIDRKQRELDEIAGWHFNVNSTPQVKKLFEPWWDEERQGWKSKDGDDLDKTNKGGPSIGKEVLARMEHPAAELITDIRSLIKTKDTFLGGHILEHAIGDRVYPTVNQLRSETGGTFTGRLSYVTPALQQIPNRDKEVASIVKACFLPDEGNVWVDCDLASFEVRVFVHLARVKKLIERYQNDPLTDAHQYTADLTGLPRDPQVGGGANAKQLNLSMIFNQGQGATAQKMGLPWEWAEFESPTGEIVRYKKAGREALNRINSYHTAMPGVLDLIHNAKQKAMKFGYVQTMFGRRIRFPDKRFTYKASGLAIQSTAADLNKLFIKEMSNALEDRGRLLLNTHDSYSFSLPEEDWEKTFKDMQAIVQDRDHIRVPLVLELSGKGNNWWAAIND